MASEDVQPDKNRPIGEHAADSAAQPPSQGQRAPETPSPAAQPLDSQAQEPSAAEPAIFGGINPPVANWYHNSEVEAINRARREADEEAPPPLDDVLEGLDEEFLNNRRRRQELLSHLFSPFYVLPLFILALLLGISTVHITIPESATVRATIAFVNYNKLDGDEQAEFQIDQERLLKSDELRAMTRGILTQGPRPVDPSYVTDTLEYHRALDRKWHPDGRLDLTVRSEDPDTDVLRLRTMAQACVTLGQLRKQDIQQYEAAAQALEDRKAAAEKQSAELRQQIEDLAPAALQESTLTAAVLSTEQYLSRLDENAPERVAAERNLQHLHDQVQAAREAGEQRDKLIAQRIELLQQINDTIDQIAQKRDLAARVVYPMPWSADNITVTDLRPASYRVLWVVTVVICAIFTVLVFLAYVRNLRREAAALGRATADTTAPD